MTSECARTKASSRWQENESEIMGELFKSG